MATAKQWAETEGKLPNNVPALRWSMSCCILELRARVEALEAAQPNQITQEELANLLAQPAPVVPLATATASSLMERVGNAIAAVHVNYPTTKRNQARAAIREVAAWLGVELKCHFGSGTYWSQQLEKEAER